MGTPNSQPAKTVAEVLRQMLNNPQQAGLSEEDLRAVDLDIELLEATYEQDIKPFLDYLARYRPLDETPPAHGYRNPWGETVARHGMVDVHRQVLKVLDTQLYYYKREWNGPEHVMVAIYLTRKGQWILSYGGGGRDRVTDEQLLQYETVRELWGKLHELVPDGFSFQYQHREGGARPPGYLPLRIEEGLREILQATVTERTKRLGIMQRALENATHRSELVKHYGR